MILQPKFGIGTSIPCALISTYLAAHTPVTVPSSELRSDTPSILEHYLTSRSYEDQIPTKPKAQLESLSFQFDTENYSFPAFIREWRKVHLKQLLEQTVRSTDEPLQAAVLQDARALVKVIDASAVGLNISADEGMLALQWSNETQGIMIIVTGDGTINYSIKKPGEFYSTNGEEFDLADGVPEKLHLSLEGIASIT